jgi:glycosyltransferase involved in cell wall biosynthesis
LAHAKDRADGSFFMRVALVAEFPAAPDRVVGGVQAVVARLARALVRRGMDVHVVSFELGRARPGVDEVDGVTVHRFPQARRFGNVTFGRAERRGTAQCLRKIHPDVVHAHLLGPAALGAVESGFPCVATAHGILREEGRLEQGGVKRIRAWARAEAEDKSLRSLRHLILSSPYVHERFGARLAGLSTYDIENPVDDAFYRIAPGGDPRVVLVPARLIPRKDPGTLLEAASRLAKSGEELRIRFTGAAEEPSFLDALQRRVRELGLEGRIEFLGPIPFSRLLQEMEGAGIIALTSLEETSPLAVMEAMASARPVVATEVGGTRHLVETGSSGWIVPSRDPEAVARGLSSLFADPSRARRFGERGRTIARSRFHVDAVVERTLGVYSAVMADARARAA